SAPRIASGTSASAWAAGKSSCPRTPWTSTSASTRSGAKVPLRPRSRRGSSRSTSWCDAVGLAERVTEVPVVLVHMCVGAAEHRAVRVPEQDRECHRVHAALEGAGGEAVAEVHQGGLLLPEVLPHPPEHERHGEAGPGHPVAVAEEDARR